MVKHTRADKLAAGLVAIGCTEVEGRSRKYRTFRKLDNEGSFYFVGRAGALRSGRSATDSVSLSDGFVYRRVLTAGEASLKVKR